MKVRELLVDEHSAGFNVGMISSVPEGKVPFSEWLGLRLGPACERFCHRHLRRQGNYQKLRALLPLLALSVVRLRSFHLASFHEFEKVLNSAVTLRHLLLAMGVASLWNTSFLLKPRRRQPARKAFEAEAGRLAGTSIVCGLLLFLGSGLSFGWNHGAELGISLALAFVATSFALLVGTFLSSTNSLATLKRPRKALMIGSGPRALAFRTMARSSHTRLDIVGCLDTEYIGTDSKRDNYLGSLDTLPALLKAQPVELVLIGLPVKSMYEDIQNVIAVCESVGVESQYMSDIFSTTRASHTVSHSSSQVSALGSAPRDVRHWLKRGLDLAIAAPLFFVLQPLFLIIAIAIKITSHGPVFFVQQRYGLHRQQFPMFKFRTMVVDAEKRQAELEGINEAQGPVFKLKSDPRVTKIGAFLRRTSLDELPQLINILRGEMSIVGPRPLPVRDVSLFEESWLLRRFSVTPGLTCLWQVRGRSNTMFDEWMKLDLDYIDSWSLGLDFKIIAQTVPAVLRGSGAM